MNELMLRYGIGPILHRLRVGVGVGLGRRTVRVLDGAGGDELLQLLERELCGHLARLVDCGAELRRRERLAEQRHLKQVELRVHTVGRYCREQLVERTPNAVTRAQLLERLLAKRAKSECSQFTLQKGSVIRTALLYS